MFCNMSFVQVTKNKFNAVQFQFYLSASYTCSEAIILKATHFLQKRKKAEALKLQLYLKS